MPIEPTLWFRWLNGRQIPALASCIGASLSLWKLALFIFIDLVLVGFYAFYWRELAGFSRCIQGRFGLAPEGQAKRAVSTRDSGPT